MVSECCIQDLKRFSILGVLLGLVAATFAGEGRVNWTHLSNLKGDLPRADVGRQAASLILDIDKDGINDFVIAGRSKQTSMVWFRWTSEGWDRYLIDNRRSHIEAGGTYRAKGAWWDRRFKYRLPVRIGAAGVQRIDKPVEVGVDFAAELKRLRAGELISEGSIRVVEVASDGRVIDDSVAFQFDGASPDGARSSTRGKLTFMLKGTTAPSSTRTFHVYFGGPKNLGHCEFEGLVAATDNVQHEGQDSIKIATNNATYYYHKKGAAFASLEDRDGNDWLGYHPGVGAISQSGSGGKYRGLPNMGHPEGYCHPGNTVSTSRIVSRGPIKVTIASESDDGKMKCRWDIFPDYARLTVLKMRTPYWFLYEGTPGGRFEMDSDFCVRATRPAGLRTAASVKWDGDISNPGEAGEWLYFADPVVNRSLFLVRHEDDEAVDSYWPMNNEMTVFGFGRQGLNKFMRTVPAQFTIGLCDDCSYSEVSKIVNSAYGDLVIRVGPVEALDR